MLYKCVVFVGAGPGNPELLTVRAREVLEANAIALVDAEVSSGVTPLIAARSVSRMTRIEMFCLPSLA